MKYRANATEVNKKPRDLRYIWSICDQSGDITVGLTYQTIRLRKKENIKWMAFTDLYEGKVMFLEPSLFDEICENWRENYFNKDWVIPTYFRTYSPYVTTEEL